MPKYKLSVGAQKLIETAIDNLFEKAKVRFLGVPNDKRLIVTATPDFSLPGLFMAAARNHGLKANTETLQDLVRIAGLYIDGTKEKTKALTIKTIQSTLATAKKDKKAPEPMRSILERELSNVWETAQNQMKTIAEVEAQTAKNMSVLDGIMHINAENSIEDPVVYFIPVKDKDLCGECKRLHLMDDEQTPRLWLMSEVGHGYHKKGESNPKMGGLHPHCRCSLLTMLPGYTFDASGHVQFLQRGWVEIDYQRGIVPLKPGRTVLKKDEDELEKMAIKDLKPGKKLPKDPTVWDEDQIHKYNYTHLLSPERRKEGYRVELHNYDENKSSVHAWRGKEYAGELKGEHDELNHGDSIFVRDVELHPEHHGKGVGKAMYEAMYAHAFHKLKLKSAKGGVHSSMASRVHQAIAEKHGLKYEPPTNPFPKGFGGGSLGPTGETGPYDNAHGPYKYDLDTPAKKTAPKKAAPKKVKKSEEPLQKAEWYWKNLKRKFEDFGWEQVEGAKHTKMVNPNLPGEPWVTIKRGHMNGPIDPEAVDAMYAKPMGLRVRHSGTDVEVDPKHPHAHHYKKLGLWDGQPEGPTPIVSWTPETAHQHVHMDSIDHGTVPAKDAWKPAMWHKKMKDEPHKVPPVKLRRLPGGERYQVVEGQDRIEGAKLSEFNHVPAEVVK